VIIASVLSGIGSFLSAIIGGQGIGKAFLGLVLGIVMAIVGYFIWAFVTYFVGKSLFHGTADYGELLRTLGYAFGPTALGVLGFIPCVGWLFSVAGFLWTLVCGFVAVREALDFDTGKAVLTVIIGWIIWLLVAATVGTILGVGVAGLSAVRGALGG
jgi:hypothetical protein